MGTPYENPPFITEPAIDGQVVVALDHPSRSIVSALKIIQVAGTPTTFRLEVFNRDPDALGGFPEKNFYVCNPKVSNAAGELLYFSDEETGGHGFTFFSQQPPGSTRIQGNTRKLFLRISVIDGGGSVVDNDVATFCVTITTEIQVGGE